MGRGRKDFFDLAAIVSGRVGRRGPVEREIARRLGPDLPTRCGAMRIDHGGQRLVVDGHAVGCVLRGGPGFGNNQCHRLTDMEALARSRAPGGTG